VALELAERVGGEIISADSRQVYRHMDIGTAKASHEERRRVPHHLIGVVDPDQDFTIVHYRDLALQAIEDVLARGKLPLLVGGSGLYIRTVTQGLAVPGVEPDPDYRRALEQRLGNELHEELAAVDAAAAAHIDPRNVRRVIRALEVWRATGRPFSEQQVLSAPAFEVRRIGLTCNRDLLYRRIDARVDQMMAAGLLEEVRDLASRYGWDLPAMSGIGYRQLGQHLRGEVDLATAVQRIKYDTHRYARQQYTWFSLEDASIRWFYVIENHQEVVETLARELSPW
jgi:tRNA dimethylallyltransferase